MPKTITSGMNTHLNLTVTTLATMWRLTRVDGTEFFFTDHDINITFEGNLYKAATGFNRSAIANNSTLGVDNLDIESVFDSADIQEVDLRGGKFDFAEIRIFMVNWSNLADGKISMRRGWLGEVVTTEQGFFRTELRGMTQVLSQSIGEIYQVECRVDLTDAKCGVPILPNLVQRNTVYKAADSQGPADFVRVNTAGVTDPILLTLGTNKGLDSLTGWTVTEGTPDIQSTTPSPQEGSGYVGATVTATYEIEQIINVDTDLTAAKIDTGDYTMDVSCFYAQDTFDTDDTGQMVVDFLTAADALVSTAFDTGTLDPPTSGTWVEAALNGIAIPATTRKIRVRLRGDEVGAASNTRFYWDNFSAQFHDVASLTLEGWEIHEDRVYECTTPGTTAATEPTYDTIIGNTTTDGTAVFTARDAFMRSATVNVVTDQETFTINNFSDARAVDDWFNGGAITWVRGSATDNNGGLTMEIRDWTNSSSTIKLFLPMGFTIESGDKLRLYPGCDKRLATCRDKFNNVVNFRGEPHIPGADALLGTIN
jgi:hypothetical protein